MFNDMTNDRGQRSRLGQYEHHLVASIVDIGKVQLAVNGFSCHWFSINRISSINFKCFVVSLFPS